MNVKNVESPLVVVQLLIGTRGYTGMRNLLNVRLVDRVQSFSNIRKVIIVGSSVN
jgi:hypothetical protein